VEAWRWRHALLLLAAFEMAFGHAVFGIGVLLVLVIGEIFAGETLWTPTVLDRGLFAYTAVVVVSGVFSPWRPVALTAAALFTGAAFVTVRAMTQTLRRSPSFAARFLVAWAIGGVVAASIAIATLGPGANSRASLPGLGHNALGTTLAASLVILLGLSTAGPRRQRVLRLAGIAVIATGLVLTFSRGAWLGACLGAGVLLLLGRSRGLLIGIAAAALVVTVTIPSLAPRWQWHLDRLGEIAVLEGPFSRFAVWRIVPAIVASHPVIGTGLGTFRFAYGERTGQGAALSEMPFAHNLLLNAAAETGVLGLAALIVFVVAGFGAAVRWHRRSAVNGEDRAVSATVLAALTGLVGQQMVDGTVMGVHIAIALFALMGLAAAGDLISRRMAAADAESSTRGML
jgi:O-antigen ligase